MLRPQRLLGEVTWILDPLETPVRVGHSGELLHPEVERAVLRSPSR